jgi:hypothetical protein
MSVRLSGADCYRGIPIYSELHRALDRSKSWPIFVRLLFRLRSLSADSLFADFSFADFTFTDCFFTAYSLADFSFAR